jgi:WD40 repeat protein
MTHHSDQHIPEDPGAVRHMKTGRRASRIIGLALAVVVAAALYVTLFRTPASSGNPNPPASSTSASSSAPPATSASPGQQIASVKTLTLSQVATLNAAGVPASVQFDPDGKIVIAADTNNQISAWSTGNWQQLGNFAAIPAGTTAASGAFLSPMFSPDGKEFSVTVANNSGSTVNVVWNAATGQETISPSHGSVPGPDGLMAGLYGTGGTAGLEVTTASGLPDAMVPVSRAAGIGYQMGTPAFSPDGRTLAVSDSLGVVHLVNVPGKRLTANLIAEKIYNTQAVNGLTSLDIDSITFSPDSQLVACGTESGIIRVWDVATRQSVSAFSVNGSASGGAAARPVKTLIFSPDGRTLVTADDADGTLTVWDVTTGHQVATLNAGSGDVASAAFSAEGTLIVATTNNDAQGHTIEIWATDKDFAASP